MALMTCADADVLDLHMSLPARGAWVALARLDTATAPSVEDQVTIDAAGGLSLKGTVVASGVHLDTAHVRLVGGAGGLATQVSGAFRSAQLRDPLDAVMRASGETLSSTVAAELLSRSLAFWTLGECRTARAIDAIAAEAGELVTWRFLADGTLWIGEETWPTAKLPDTAVIEVVFPTEKRSIIAVETPALLPGVDLEGVGRVVAVDHWVWGDRVRTWAWVA